VLVGFDVLAVVLLVSKVVVGLKVCVSISPIYIYIYIYIYILAAMVVVPQDLIKCIILVYLSHWLLYGVWLY